MVGAVDRGHGVVELSGYSSNRAHPDVSDLRDTDEQSGADGEVGQGPGVVGGLDTPSKSALTSLTVQYANELRKDGILVNAVAPGFVDTDSNNHTGFLTVEQGAAVLVRYATLDGDGPTAGFFSEDGPVPW